MLRPARDRAVRPLRVNHVEGTSSTGRASVSKTEGWGFKSLVPCEDRTVPDKIEKPMRRTMKTRKGLR